MGQSYSLYVIQNTGIRFPTKRIQSVLNIFHMYKVIKNIPLSRSQKNGSENPSELRTQKPIVCERSLLSYHLIK